jgi:hypothetical protein
MWDDLATAIGMADAVIALAGLLALGLGAGARVIKITFRFFHRLSRSLLLVDIA